jgi:perosamine synthetase
MIPIAVPLIGDEELHAIEIVLLSGMLASGEFVSEFEMEFANY